MLRLAAQMPSRQLITIALFDIKHKHLTIHLIYVLIFDVRSTYTVVYIKACVVKGLKKMEYCVLQTDIYTFYMQNQFYVSDFIHIANNFFKN